MSRDQGAQRSRSGLSNKFWVNPNREKNIIKDTSCLSMVQHDQGGAIGLAFKFFDGFFFVVWVFGIVVERGVVRTYARTSKASLPARTIVLKHNNQTSNIWK